MLKKLRQWLCARINSVEQAKRVAHHMQRERDEAVAELEQMIDRVSSLERTVFNLTRVPSAVELDGLINLGTKKYRELGYSKRQAKAVALFYAWRSDATDRRW